MRPPSRRLIASFCAAGHADGEPLWNWVHNTFFGPTREQSYLDNWDGELNDMVNALQEQVTTQSGPQVARSSC